MTLVHMVFFRFRADVTQEHKDTFVRELRKLKDLSCVKDNRLIVGGPSVTDPIERSKGFEFALLSYHENRAALDEYQASKEHTWVTQTYLFPFKEDLCRFDFEVAPEDEYMCIFDSALEPPTIDGVRKPKKPGGYQDSGADIGFNLSQCENVEVVTPSKSPNPTNDGDWCFPDTEEGILDAISKGATYLWANTIVFASHPLQTSSRLENYEDRLRVVGQGPLVVDKYDDKQFVNDCLRALGGFTMPRNFTFPSISKLSTEIDDLSYPVVVKPIRGRGSYGVKVCHNKEQLWEHAQGLSSQSMAFMIEEFLQGEEATVTVMPPTQKGQGYWALPVVSRFNHQDGIAPYNGIVAITENSKLASNTATDPIYKRLSAECERAASVLGLTAPIRIDVRRFKDAPDSPFALFDVNMKPNMTGPGRPNRDDQASLTLMAANGLGWDYKKLLRRILGTFSSLKTLRGLKPVDIQDRV
ncbi:hypothetical protein G7Z17_g7868 [Cylindrodendrum hubeiense]|uniref:Stress-response A/B barrel domain-containing protein n=1 Tax=Cylindrodendrum hubeiense TaxID=595255 RepID=A0A9P5H6C8_9HYPO|nr:hypothetical protein G7Z17_g7868 [Cylindrodendrum hubeiense]